MLVRLMAMNAVSDPNATSVLFLRIFQRNLARICYFSRKIFIFQAQLKLAIFQIEADFLQKIVIKNNNKSYYSIHKHRVGA